MAKIRLRSLEGIAYRSFIDRFSINFPENGMFLIQGQNKDTGGSSGSGKSNLLAAINQALGCSPFAGTEVQSWGKGKPPWKLKLALDAKGHALALSKGAKSCLEVDDKAVPGGAAVVAEVLSSHLELDSESLALLTYRSQKEPGLFLSKTDAEKKVFLTRLLGLHRFEDEIEATTSRLIVIKNQLSVTEGVLAATTTAYEQSKLYVDLEWAERYTQEKGAAVGLLARAEDQIVLKTTERANIVQVLEANLAKVEKTTKAILDEIGTRWKALEELPVTKKTVPTSELYAFEEVEASYKAAANSVAQKRSEHKATIEVLESRFLVLSKRMAGLPAIRSSLVRLRGEVSKLDLNKCPTCERTWDKALEQIAIRNTEISQLDETEKDILRLVPVIQSFEHKISDAKQSAASIETELNEAADKRNAATNRYNVIVSKIAMENKTLESERVVKTSSIRSEIQSAKQQAEIDRADLRAEQTKDLSELTELLNKHTSVKQKYEQILDQLEIENKRNETNQARAEEARVKSETARVVKDNTYREWAKERDFLDLAQTFLSKVFDECLGQVADEANRIMAAVANIRHCSLYFRSEIETQKGTVQKKLIPIIRIGTNECAITISGGRPRCAGLSGGMLTAVELAVDLAVGHVVSQRTGVFPGWLILDEALEGLGAVEKESCMEILQQYAQDRLVLVVDHDTQFKSMFTRMINVVYKNGQSTIEEK